MSTDTKTKAETIAERPLDESFYRLTADEASFYKAQTGITDDDELKKHIMAVQAKAYQVFPYSCIRSFGFSVLKVSKLPAYDQVLKLGRERKGAILLDIGCCFGTDLRKAVADGFPKENVVGSDIHADFWKLGYELFRDTKDTFPAPFVAADAFDDEKLQPVEPYYSPVSVAIPPPDLSSDSLTSLNPLRGHVSALHASAFFHLFDEEQQLDLARRLAGLLSPEPGSIIFGAHGGRETKGQREFETRGGRRMFCHNPESWKELWDGTVFKKGTVEVEAFLFENKRSRIEAGYDKVPKELKALTLVWSVKRL
ncbi:hypothetical protein CONPUDRAFT_152322 [Coniophora puteana RWD-64-598 SS2]|uniref:Methyltransferase domain-containing protein n=1 Tax=Coniophora puteana (strain RWD-64-598) TaxID=741705 RepID=A0A5M3MWD2_CONPW|nr:uncharacterized protein CONPUDRAFT_152322 [Coniophora puteana RWD-64-598 SS2]EIW83297.1 hypothetical protein CONPUDRAFT_152322 [Coniophora puteana RWD-64-598 SS2]